MLERVAATYRDGNVVMDQSVDWPDGTRIEVRALSQPSPASDDLEALSTALDDPDSCGLDESLWPQTPDGIAMLLEHMDGAEPLELSPEEQQTIEAERTAIRRMQKERMSEGAVELEKLF